MFEFWFGSRLGFNTVVFSLYYFCCLEEVLAISYTATWWWRGMITPCLLAKGWHTRQNPLSGELKVQKGEEPHQIWNACSMPAAVIGMYQPKAHDNWTNGTLQSLVKDLETNPLRDQFPKALCIVTWEIHTQKCLTPKPSIIYYR